MHRLVPTTRVRRLIQGCLSTLSLVAVVLLLSAITGPPASAQTRTISVLPALIYQSNISNSPYQTLDGAVQQSKDRIQADAAAQGDTVTLGGMFGCTVGAGYSGGVVPFNYNFQPAVWCVTETLCSAGGCAPTSNREMALAWPYCPRGFTIRSITVEYQLPDGTFESDKLCSKTVPDAQPCPCDSPSVGLTGAGSFSDSFGNPIVASDGTKRQTELDYADPHNRLVFERLYRSDTGIFTNNYQTQFRPPTWSWSAVQAGANPPGASYCDPAPTAVFSGKTISLPPTCFPYANNDANNDEAQAADPSGFLNRFTWNGTIATPVNGSTTDSVSQTSSGTWIWKRAVDGLLEVYDPTGLLLQRVSLNGDVDSFAYSDSSTPAATAPAPGYLVSVTEQFGRKLSFTYDSVGHLASMTDPNNRTTTYTYSDGTAGAPMTSVSYPDGTSRQYVWNETAQISNPSAAAPQLLTGIVDELGVRYATFGYNGLYAASTQHAGGVDKYTITAFAPYQTAAISDPLNASREYDYSTTSGLVYQYLESQPACAGCRNSVYFSSLHDNNANLTWFHDFNWNQTCLAYDTARNLETLRLEGVDSDSSCPTTLLGYQPAAGSIERLISTQWHPNWRLPTSKAEPGRITTWVYNGQVDPFAGGTATCAPPAATLPDGEPLVVLCKLVEQATTDATGGGGFGAMALPGVAPRIRQWQYNASGQVLTDTDPRGNVTTYSYYADSTSGHTIGDLQFRSNALGQKTTFNSYTASGQILQSTDANGVATTYTYDLRGRLTSRSIAGETTTFSYYPTGLLQTVTLPDGSYLTYTYDGAHRLTQINDRLGNKIVYTLDAIGNHTAETTYDPSGTLHRTHTRAFNILNQLYQDIAAANTAAVTTTYGYDSNGNQTSAAAPLSRNSGQAYDALNRVIQSTDPAGGITGFTYDERDNLISVTDPRMLVTSYSYDGLGDVVTRSSPDTGTATNTYDSAGNLSTHTDARGAISGFTYDPLNRVTTVTYSRAGTTDQTVTFTYDTARNGIGRLTGAADANHVLSWSYDAVGRVISKSQTIGGVTKSVGYTYTSGDLTTVTTPSGQTVAYAYNANHQIASVTVNTSPVLTAVTYEPLGPVNGWTWGNGTSSNRVYNGDGNIAQISSNGVKSYAYDDALRITGVTDTSSGASNWTYGYDTLNRLTSAANGAVTRGWTYDAAGNRLTETGSAPSTYSIDAASNRITGITGSLARTYTYDAAGHTTGYSSVTAAYDNAGQLKTITKGSVTETLVYNALRQRIKTSGGPGGTVLYWYDEQGHLLGEYDSSGNLIEETVWLGDIPVATLRPIGGGVAIYYIHADQLNTPRQITRPTDNAQMWTWYSDPFGTDAANANPEGGGTFGYNLRFPGQMFDGQVGLHSNGYRNFDPAVGRYIESDPIGLGGGINTYAYVRSNPLRGYDPLGLVEPETEREDSLERERLPGPDQELVDFATARLIENIRDYDPDFQDQTVGGPRTWEDVQRLQEILKERQSSCTRNTSGSNPRSPKHIYSARELVRRAAEPGPYHNFPGSYDDLILQYGQRQDISDNYVLYTLPGIVNGDAGTFELGVRPSESGGTEVVVHRFFRPLD